MADDRKLELIFDDAGRRPEEVLVDTSQFQRTRQTAFQTDKQYDPRFNIKPGDYDDYIKTHMAEFSANIKKVTGDDSIETDPRQYLNTALDYSEIQTASDLNQFVKDHPKLSNNADIKTQLDNLRKVWDLTEEGPATGKLKEEMVETAQKIANADILMTSRDLSKSRSNIQTDEATFNANISEVKNTRVIVTNANVYQTIANDYASIKTTKDFKSFIQNNELLLANAEIKEPLLELGKLWRVNGVSSPATGELKDRMNATAQKIANAEFTIIDHDRTERLANALEEANTAQSLNQLANNEPLLEGAVMLKKMQLSTLALASVSPEIANDISNYQMMKLDGPTIIRDTGILPQKSSEIIEQYQHIRDLLQSALPQELPAANEPAEISP